MYVDESGDTGISPHSSKHFILSGLVINQNDWDKFLARLKAFRKSIKDTYGLNQRTEIHAKELLRVEKLMEYKKIAKKDRVKILKDYTSQIPLIFDTAFIINVCIDKETIATGRDVFELGWGRMLQRYDTFLKKDAKDKGVVIVDGISNIKLMTLHRKMRVYNPVPSRITPPSHNVPIDNVLEDVFGRESHHSYFIQTVDVIAYTLFRKEFIKGSLKKYGLEFLFDKLDTILLKKASNADPQGIVRQ